ncbi:MAG: substrate-binding domain-containing protein [Planctomycetes bacterium]|nr:substrate-binding domain-containing protein [Planctomycetota bacterium]
MRARVGLVVDLETRHGVDVLRGACRIGHDQGWELRFARQPWSEGGEAPFPRPLDGVIGYLGQDPAQRLRLAGLAVVDLRQQTGAPPPPALIAEADAGSCAARHLLDQGLRSLGVVSSAAFHAVGAQRIAGFKQAAQEAGAACQVFCPPLERPAELIAALVPWLAALPVPTGVFGVGDWYADLVLTACREAGLPVPARIAVVGADNDPLRCLLADVPLSSLAMPHEELGAAAALHLAALLAGRDPGPPVVLSPGPVIARASSDGLACSDPLLARVSVYIREHLADDLAVERIAAAAGLNRRTLERRFRGVLRRSVHDEIRRIRVQRGMELLADRDLPVSAVAAACGLSHNAFITAFQAVAGAAPGAWRQARRARPMG